MEWFLFPENKESYNFNSSSGNSISFEKDEYEFTEDGYVLEKSCNFNFLGPSSGESCDNPFLKAVYLFEDIQITNGIIQTSGSNFSSIIIEKDGNTVFVYEDENIIEETNVFTFSNSLEINGQIYNDILSFNFDDDSGTVYISKGNGMIRLVLDDEVYDIE